MDGAFSLPCVLFGRANNMQKLVRSPQTMWTSATGQFKKHSQAEGHNHAVLAIHNFVRVMRRQVVPVDQQLDNVMQRQIEKNPTILSLLFKTVIFCGQHNNAPRGHREEGPMEGNFQALLAFRVESDDDTLQQHLENAPRSARCVSKTIQNEMISTVGMYIVNNQTREMKNSRYFSTLADESADISNKENLSVVIRFVDSEKREEFFGYFLCDQGTTGRSIRI